jgi:hypothetical protein
MTDFDDLFGPRTCPAAIGAELEARTGSLGARSPQPSPGVPGTGAFEMTSVPDPHPCFHELSLETPTNSLIV